MLRVRSGCPGRACLDPWVVRRFPIQVDAPCIVGYDIVLQSSIDARKLTWSGKVPIASTADVQNTSRGFGSRLAPSLVGHTFD